MSLLYSAASGMQLQARRQEANALNLANTTTAGYKRNFVVSTAFQQEFLNQTGATNVKTNLGPTEGRIMVDWSQGQLKPTQRALDFAIHGDGFFEVHTANGQKLFTRNGNFQLNSQGNLMTPEGYTVAAVNGNITFNPDSPSLDNLQVTTDGYLRMEDFGQLTDLGQLKIVNIPDKNKLLRISDKYFALNEEDLADIKQLDYYRPQSDGQTNYAVLNTHLESSNSSAMKGMATMISAIRAYEINQKVIKQTRHLGQKERETFRV